MGIHPTWWSHHADGSAMPDLRLAGNSLQLVEKGREKLSHDTANSELLHILAQDREIKHRHCPLPQLKCDIISACPSRLIRSLSYLGTYRIAMAFAPAWNSDD